jgi:DNA-binding SARP family transcriptional activator
VELDRDISKTAGSAIVGSPPALRFLLFGHARVFANGQPFRLATPRKTLPLLAYLLLNREAAVSRSFLAFLIWPDESEDDARAKLRATLHDLVKVLPPAPEGHWIVIEGTNVRWNPDAQIALDVDEFETLLCLLPSRTASSSS